MVRFNIPTLLGDEIEKVKASIESRVLCGNGPFTKKVEALLNDRLKTKSCLLTPSCTDALEMSAMLLDIKYGDEIIVPSFTFVSTALAFTARGARIKYVDIRPDTLNIDEKLIEQAITQNTKAIVPVHYAGVACEMETINSIAKKNKIAVVEDAAQAVGSFYNNKPLGSLGDLATFSYHETKNINCGEGGSLVVNNENYVERAEIIREKGTNRKKFLEGLVDKYSWVDTGSSFLMNDYTAAFLYSQLLQQDQIISTRMNSWNYYFKNLSVLKNKEVGLPKIPQNVVHNAHLFYLITRSNSERQKLQKFLLDNGVQTASHYVALHSSHYGRQTGYFVGDDAFTTDISTRLLRLPLHNYLTEDDLSKIVQLTTEFYR